MNTTERRKALEINRARLSEVQDALCDCNEVEFEALRQEARDLCRDIRNDKLYIQRHGYKKRPSEAQREADTKLLRIHGHA